VGGRKKQSQEAHGFEKVGPPLTYLKQLQQTQITNVQRRSFASAGERGVINFRKWPPESGSPEWFALDFI
jgi:hypothetical protein